MLKRLLLSAIAGSGVFFIWFIILFSLDSSGVYIKESVYAVCGALSLITSLFSTVTVFRKVKTKNTIIEDIVINKAKIMKAEQEVKLNELNK